MKSTPFPDVHGCYGARETDDKPGPNAFGPGITRKINEENQLIDFRPITTKREKNHFFPLCHQPDGRYGARLLFTKHCTSPGFPDSALQIIRTQEI
ncbi:hypothetical protein FEM41_15610 [Jejubacter calystegiae]|uniref:Uncharacterized protein n=1 Tax=Jejubacter calystegiae TaxID=2579935 RepID=A0A4P8YM64_9ENTR|nr:hypothetical protein FEM41_15610 [Jejubacter calystegiae]